MHSPSTRVQKASLKRDVAWENHLDFMSCILYREHFFDGERLVFSSFYA